MALKVVDIGLSQLLSIMLNRFAATNFLVHLYKNNYTPVAGSVLGDFTEADFNGYAAQDPGAWSAPAADGLGRYFSVASLLTWSPFPAGGPSNSIYGYYVTDSGGTILLWAEKFSLGPYTMSAITDVLYLLPRFTDKSEF